MTDLTFVGVALIGFAVIGGSMLLGTTISARAEANRKRIEERFEKQVEDLRREADSWRMAYEESRIENIQLKARLDIQNMVYGKYKVKDIKSKGEKA